MFHLNAPQAAPIPDQRRWWAFHEAGYGVAARVLGVAITPSRDRPLRCFEGDLQWPITAEHDIEALAVVALAGHVALERAGGEGDRDSLLAADLIFQFELAARYGASRTVAHCREHMTARMKELAARASTLVDENWHEIEATAAELAAR